MHNVEDVFVTEGVPSHTFVKPPNYGLILADIRRAGKPVIIEGQTGTGKTTAVKMALKEIYGDQPQILLTPREPDHLAHIQGITEASGAQLFVIDDFHRLQPEIKERLANLSKLIAERDDRSNLPKIIIIGINNVGSALIHQVPDVAKRMGIHKIETGSQAVIERIVNLGCKKLNVTMLRVQDIFTESRGDYWMTQQLCKAICLASDVSNTQSEIREVDWNQQEIKRQVVQTLRHAYELIVKEFCRGRRFRPTNDPYFKLLRAVSEQESSSVDLTQLANIRQDIKGSINNIKENRLEVLLNQKADCARLFHYDLSTKVFSLEDPALFYFLKNLNWDELRASCGFRDDDRDFEFDVAVSFAGENRELVSFAVEQWIELDINVFYDRHYEDNYLGKLWSERFEDIFANKSRLVVAFLDIHHREKVWPTFERDCFKDRAGRGEVIPIFLDDTAFAGISRDTASIQFRLNGAIDAKNDDIINNIVLRVASRLEESH